MAIQMSRLVPLVRSAISDVPADFLTNTQITNELNKSKAFCDLICVSTTSESYLQNCYVVVATYYSYLNYTALSERNLGTLPPTAAVRLKALRELAASFLQPVSNYPLNSDLTIDSESYKTSMTASIHFTPSVIEE